MCTCTSMTLLYIQYVCDNYGVLAATKPNLVEIDLDRSLIRLITSQFIFISVNCLTPQEQYCGINISL